MKQLRKAIEHNRFTILGLTLGIMLIGCQQLFQATVQDPMTGDTVNASQLQRNADLWLAEKEAEIQSGIRQYNAAGDELAEEQSRIDRILAAIDTGINIADPSGGTATIVGLLLTAAGIGADNRRKDGVIKDKRIEVLEAKTKA